MNDTPVAFLTVGSMGSVKVEAFDAALSLPQGVHNLVLSTHLTAALSGLQEAEETLIPYMELANDRLHTIANLRNQIGDLKSMLMRAEETIYEWVEKHPDPNGRFADEAVHQMAAAVDTELAGWRDVK